MKLKKVRELGISALEIDLSRACHDFSPESLFKAVIEETANKKWLYNVKAEFWRGRYLRTTEKLGTTQREFSLLTEHCPINKRYWKGKHCANVLEDCYNGEFFVGIGENNEYVICGGEHKITTFEQLQAY